MKLTHDENWKFMNSYHCMLKVFSYPFNYHCSLLTIEYMYWVTIWMWFSLPISHDMNSLLQMLLRCCRFNAIQIRSINGGIFNGDNRLISAPDAQHSHFKVFEIDPPSFDIDVRSLSHKFKALQTKLHPDKFATAGQDQVQLAEAWSARVNDAYQVIINLY